MDVPGIFNTGQGSQFTSEAFTSVLSNRGVQISMDSAGGLRGQRVRRAAVEEREARRGVPKGIRECGRGQSRNWSLSNNERPHQALERRTPAQVVEEGRNQVHQPELSANPRLAPA